MTPNVGNTFGKKEDEVLVGDAVVSVDVALAVDVEEGLIGVVEVEVGSSDPGLVGLSM